MATSKAKKLANKRARAMMAYNPQHLEAQAQANDFLASIKMACSNNCDLLEVITKAFAFTLDVVDVQSLNAKIALATGKKVGHKISNVVNISAPFMDAFSTLSSSTDKDFCALGGSLLALSCCMGLRKEIYTLGKSALDIIANSSNTPVINPQFVREHFSKGVCVKLEDGVAFAIFDNDLFYLVREKNRESYIVACDELSLSKGKLVPNEASSTIKLLMLETYEMLAKVALLMEQNKITVSTTASKSRKGTSKSSSSSSNKRTQHIVVLVKYRKPRKNNGSVKHWDMSNKYTEERAVREHYRTVRCGKGRTQTKTIKIASFKCKKHLNKGIINTRLVA